MHAINMRTVADEAPESWEAPPPLNDVERALLSVLDTQLVSTSVVRDRARLKVRETSPKLASTGLAACQPISTITSALEELEKRGLAQSIQMAKCVRWRRASEADERTSR